MARDAVERGTQTRELGRTVDYVDDVQDAVDILVRAGVDEPRSLTSLTRESRVDLSTIQPTRSICRPQREAQQNPMNRRLHVGINEDRHPAAQPTVREIERLTNADAMRVARDRTSQRRAWRGLSCCP